MKCLGVATVLALLCGIIWVIWFTWSQILGQVGDVITDRLGPTTKQQVVINASHSSYSDFLEKTCEIKAICIDYEKVKISCAVAANLQDCIAIRMSNKDYAICDSMKITENSIDYNFIPSDAQCLTSKTGNSILKSIGLELVK